MNIDDEWQVIRAVDDFDASKLHMVAARKPQEIIDFERETDPYRNFLPGVSSIQAARTVGRGLQEGKRGNRLVLAISLVLVFVIVLPAILEAIAMGLH